jgi:hypothetical protein
MEITTAEINTTAAMPAPMAMGIVRSEAAEARLSGPERADIVVVVDRVAVDVVVAGVAAAVVTAVERAATVVAVVVAGRQSVLLEAEHLLLLLEMHGTCGCGRRQNVKAVNFAANGSSSETLSEVPVRSSDVSERADGKRVIGFPFRNRPVNLVIRPI